MYLIINLYRLCYINNYLIYILILIFCMNCTKIVYNVGVFLFFDITFNTYIILIKNNICFYLCFIKTMTWYKTTKYKQMMFFIKTF